jgi:hypothetical protein
LKIYHQNDFGHDHGTIDDLEIDPENIKNEIIIDGDYKNKDEKLDEESNDEYEKQEDDEFNPDMENILKNLKFRKILNNEVLKGLFFFFFIYYKLDRT